MQAKADIIWTASPEGQPAEVQEWTEFTGLAREHIPDALTEHLHPDDAPLVLEEWRQAIAGTQPFVSQHRLRHRNGQWRHMQVHAVPVLDDDGHVRDGRVRTRTSPTSSRRNDSS